MNLKQLITIWTHDLLDWLTSKFDSITIDTSDLAKEATLNSVGLDAAAAKTAAQGISGYALQGSDPTATNTSLEILLQSIITTMYKGVPIVSQSGNATISPNTWNVWNNSLNSLTVTKGSDISGVLNVYNMRFLVGSNFQLSFSGFDSVLWVNGVAPTFVEGHIYEISIVESRGVWAEF